MTKNVCGPCFGQGTRFALLFTLCLFASGNSTVEISQKRNVIHSFLGYGSQSLDHAVQQVAPGKKILQEKQVGPLEVPKLIVNIVEEDIVLSDCLTSFKLICSVS